MNGRSNKHKRKKSTFFSVQKFLSGNDYLLFFSEAKLTKSAVPKVMMPVTFSKEGQQHVAYGVGSNKSQAKRAAAKLALKILAA